MLVSRLTVSLPELLAFAQEHRPGRCRLRLRITSVDSCRLRDDGDRSSNTTYNYDLTIWHPCRNQTPTGTNCCFLPALGYDTALYGWCGDFVSNSFIIGSQITLQQSQ